MQQMLSHLSEMERSQLFLYPLISCIIWRERKDVVGDNVDKIANVIKKEGEICLTLFSYGIPDGGLRIALQISTHFFTSRMLTTPL